MSKKILSIGSCGFILSNFVRKANKEKYGYQICSIDKVSSQKDIHNIYSNKSHNFYIGSTLDKHFLDTVFEIEKPDVVLHGGLEYSGDHLNNNIIGTNNLIQCCNEYNSKLYLLSSDSIYGNNSEDDVSFTEESELKINSIQRISQDTTEKLVLHYGGSVLRLSYVYGPRSRIGLIPSVIKSIINQGRIVTDKNYVYDFTHVDDVISAIITIIENGKDNVYNITSSHDFSEQEVVDEVLKLIPGEYSLMPINTISSYHNCSNDKLRSLGWKTEHTLQNWLPKVIQWYINNQWFLKD